MQEYRDMKFTEERALFGAHDLEINGCVFDKGESPLKETRNLKVSESLFRYKYPFWYADHIQVDQVTFFDMARAGIWYTKNFSMSNAIVEAPKNFRRCQGVSLNNVMFSNALETLWTCDGVTLEHVKARGPYFAMNSRNMRVHDLDLIGDYSFDGVVNLEISDSHLASKDAFWNTENVTVRNSFVTGEYLGWNAKNLTLINCAIESLQGLCYIDGLKMVNCKLINTTLAFEYSTVDAQISGKIDSVLNPRSGVIRADRIGQLILERDQIDPGKTTLLCDTVDAALDRAAWRKEDQP